MCWRPILRATRLSSASSSSTSSSTARTSTSSWRRWRRRRADGHWQRTPAVVKAVDMTQRAVAVSASNSFVAELEAANLHPLWDRFKKITPVRPQPRDAPLVWRWKDIEKFAERATGEVAIDDVERR